MIATNNTQESHKIVSKLIALAWLDRDLYHRLLNNTAEVLREAGVILEEFAQVVVNQSPTVPPGLRLATADCYELCLPPCPADMASNYLFMVNQAQEKMILNCVTCICGTP